MPEAPSIDPIRLPLPNDLCPACGATRIEIRETGHRWLDSAGRVAFADTPNRLPCPESCTCIPECFSMREHRERT